MLSSAVTAKGQVTIPKEIRILLDIHTGERMSFRLENDRLILQKKMNNVEAAFGLLKTKKSVSLEEMDMAIRKGAQGDRD